MRRHLGGERHRVGAVGDRRRRRRARGTCTGRRRGNPGQNSSQTPDEPSTRIGASLPFQPLNSPIRLTPLALGAHTANDTPSTTPSARGEGARMCAKDFPEPFVAALAEQVQVDLAQRRQEAVGVGDDVRLAARHS